MARRQKLKVYRTPIGFHDAYVAAPSQKAALEAWGSDANLFARGVAEQVTDEDLIREPLESPGTIIKRLRGSADDHVAALPADTPKPKRKKATTPASAKRAQPSESAAPKSERPAAMSKPKRKPKPRPSRAALESAERALDGLAERHAREEAEIRSRQRELERERRALESAHQREVEVAEKAVERERKANGKALDRWIASER